MEAFEYTALPARVIFGSGTLPRIADEVAALGCKRAFVLSDPYHATAAAARLMDALGKLGVHLSSDAVFGVKRSLVFRRELKAGTNTVEYHFGLVRESQPGSRRPGFVAAGNKA